MDTEACWSSNRSGQGVPSPSFDQNDRFSPGDTRGVSVIYK